VATYLNGNQDFIPALQPFRPDLNYHANILQARQGQYDAAHSQISQAYSTLLNAPMLAEENIAARDKFFKAMEGEVKKISKLDLSQEQNVSAAMGAFRPLYDNKDIINDMVKTKQWQNNIGKGESLKDCTDPDKCGGQYWDVGMAEQTYWAKDFKNASREDRLKMQAPDFTPYIDVQSKIAKFANEQKIDVVATQSDGKWIYTHKNGALIERPLHNLLLAKFGNDPAMQKMFQTQAYVDMKSTIEATTPEFGSADAAESHYLNTKYKELSDKALKRDSHLKQQVAAVSNKAAVVESLAKTHGVDPENPDDGLATSWAEVKRNQQNAEGAHKVTEQGTNLVKAPLNGDRKSLITKVQGLLAADYLHDHVDLGAESWTQLHSESTQKDDPYGLAAVQHSYALSLQNSAHQYDWMKHKDEQQFKKDFETAKHKRDNPTVDPNQTAQAPGAGSSTHQFSVKGDNEAKLHELGGETINDAQTYVTSVLDNFVGTIKNSKDPDKVTNAKNAFKQIVGRDWNSEKDKTFASEEFTQKQVKDLTKTFNTVKAVYDDYTSTKQNGVVLGVEQRNLVSNINALEAKLKLTADASNTIRTIQEKNDKVVKGMFDTDASLDTDLKATKDLAFKDNRFVSENEFVRSYVNKRIEANTQFALSSGMNKPAAIAWAKQKSLDANSAEDAKDTYTKLADKYAEYEKNDNGKLAHYSQNVSVSRGSGGLTTKPITQVADLSHPNQSGTQGILGVEQDLKEGKVEKVIWGSGDNITDKDYAGIGDDANARLVAQTFFNAIKSGDFGKGKNHPVTDFKVVGIAANNPNLVQYTVTLPQSWMHERSLTGTDKKPGILGGNPPENNSITFFVPKDQTENPVYKNDIAPSKTDIILNGGDEVVRKFSHDGSYAVRARKDGQGYHIDATIPFVNDNGKVETKAYSYIDIQPHINSKTLFQNLDDQFTALEAQNNQYLTDVHNKNPKVVKGAKAVEALNQSLAAQGIVQEQQ